jgi:hypothetical protein
MPMAITSAIKRSPLVGRATRSNVSAKPIQPARSTTGVGSIQDTAASKPELSSDARSRNRLPLVTLFVKTWRSVVGVLRAEWLPCMGEHADWLERALDEAIPERRRVPPPLQPCALGARHPAAAGRTASAPRRPGYDEYGSR